MNHEYVDKLCIHCGLPRKRADRNGCPVNKYGEPAAMALAAIGLTYVGFELNGMYANYQDPLSPGFCGRMFWPQIEAILELRKGGGE